VETRHFAADRGSRAAPANNKTIHCDATRDLSTVLVTSQLWNSVLEKLVVANLVKAVLAQGFITTITTVKHRAYPETNEVTKRPQSNV
jgi:C4-type Zn-finger protein